MRKWNHFFDMMSFPIKVLFVAFIMLGVGSLPTNQIVSLYLDVNNEALMEFFNIIRYFGVFIINNIPLVVIICMVGRKRDSLTPVFSAVLGFVMFMVVCAFLSPTEFGAQYYSTILGININSGDYGGITDQMLLPFQTGLIGAVFVVWTTRIAFRITRDHNNNSFLGFIDQDTYCIIITVIGCFISGILVSLLWPFVISLIESIMLFISQDITNPLNLFIYGVFDRVMSITGLSNVSNYAFWFDTFGGSWMDPNGINYVGDINVWTAQQNNLIVSAGAGRLITPYYLLNMFAVPAVMFVAWNCSTFKRERMRYLSFLVLGSIVSILFGTLLPFELFLLFTAPVLLLVHLIVTGLLFGLLQVLGIFIGYNFTGSYMYANPGGFIDLFPYFNDTFTRSNFYMLLIIGAVVFVFYALVAHLYYNYLSFGIMNSGNNKVIDRLVLSIGGLGNLRNIQASYDKVTVTVINPNIVDLKPLMDSGVRKFSENKEGYHIYFGSDSVMIRKEVLRRLRGQSK